MLTRSYQIRHAVPETEAPEMPTGDNETAGGLQPGTALSATHCNARVRPICGDDDDRQISILHIAASDT